CDDNQHTNRQYAQLVIHTGQSQPDVERVHDQCSKDGAGYPSTTAEQAGPADHDRCDGLQVGAYDRVRAGRARPADQHPGAEAVDQPRNGVDAEEHAVDLDANQPGRLDVIADGVQMTAPAGLTENE